MLKIMEVGTVSILPNLKNHFIKPLCSSFSMSQSVLNHTGTCFPMGKGMYQVIHIPEDESVLLNSREKAPYLICIEVLKSESPRYPNFS